ncbi:SAICAR synthase-like protein [Nadsonia fulvescens var. elongata DSM 6958]|uniref:1-phosphatidylinositol-4-phosphate 5-kinase n=1 Tax=Nadsonia fulvescens var. elongata DSM 6958 TaxID=857566 RepID=A0A1E3PCN9_9ASCO|nr:SAICAR synthase-like protein [Nadsonia fulvescens var. elongata DSM 6958]
MSSVTTTLESVDSMINKPIHHKTHVLLTPLPNMGLETPIEAQFHNNIGINEPSVYSNIPTSGTLKSLPSLPANRDVVSTPLEKKYDSEADSIKSLRAYPSASIPVLDEPSPIPASNILVAQPSEDVDDFIFDYSDYYQETPKQELEEDFDFMNDDNLQNLKGPRSRYRAAHTKLIIVSPDDTTVKLPPTYLIEDKSLREQRDLPEYKIPSVIEDKGKSVISGELSKKEIIHSSASTPTLTPENKGKKVLREEFPMKDKSAKSLATTPQLEAMMSRRDTISGLPADSSAMPLNFTNLNRRRTHPSTGQSVDSFETGDVQAKIRQSVIIAREKRRQSKWQEDDRVLMGTKISEGHGNYITAYNMLTGIRVSVSRCNAKVEQPLVDQDFFAKNKLAFDISGNELIPSAKYDFKFKDYSPLVFRHLRQLFKLDPADYLMSLTSKYIVSELGSPGKSGSFFYFSRDFRFIIKTIHHAEHRMLRSILKEYYNHVKSNPDTLISQFYGLHRVKLPFGRKIHFVVMNNLFPPNREIHRTYDLKGSFVGRETYLSSDCDNDAARRASEKRSKVLKDLNWLKGQDHIVLGPAKREMFFRQLEKDVKLLERLNMMDYSLLIGISELKAPTNNTNENSSSLRGLSYFGPDSGSKPPQGALELRKAIHKASPTALEEFDLPNSDNFRSSFMFYHDIGGFQATDELDQPLPMIYYLGVIDCLTGYGIRKKLETFWLGLTTKTDRGNYTCVPKSMDSERLISAVPAREYGERFLKFMRTITRKEPNITAPV